MSREPNWYRMGLETADGTKKSLMNLPAEFFTDQSKKIYQDDFNVIKFAHDYAKLWLETEQWKQEVGQKIQIFTKKFSDDDMKVDEFMWRACQWVDGYAELIIMQFRFMYTSPISCETAQNLIEQALFKKKQETGEKKDVTGRNSKNSG